MEAEPLIALQSFASKKTVRAYEDERAGAGEGVLPPNAAPQVGGGQQGTGA